MFNLRLQSTVSLWYNGANLVIGGLAKMIEWLKTHKALWISGLVALVVLLVGAGGTAYWYYSPNQRVKRAESGQIKLMQRESKQMYQTPPHKTVAYSAGVNIPDFDQLMEQRSWTQYQANGKYQGMNKAKGQSKTARQQAQKLYLRGQVSLPKYQIDVPIFEGTSQATLAWGAGTVKSGQVMGQGNYAISAHNMEKASYASNWLFSNLQTGVAKAGDISYSHVRIPIGAKIYSYDGKNVYEYRVATRNIVNANDPHAGDVVLDSQAEMMRQPLITLTTCYEQVGIRHPVQRIIIQGSLVKKTPKNQFKQLHQVFHNV